jgi:hypothetical protein
MRKLTQAEKDYMAKVKRLPCCACNASPPSLAHHVRKYERAREPGLTIPLCPECHVGSFSIHETPKQFEAVHGSQILLLAKTIIDVSNLR